jgi:predicted Zn-dependent peptidase
LWVRTLLVLLISGACVVSSPARTAAQPAEPLPPNPFAAFESLQLANGLRLWYGHLPAATLTTMALVVPYGSDHDPRGREQTAHLLEHVLFSDRHGRTEAELVRELTSRGGILAGVTSAHYTSYSVSIDTEHAAYGVEWLHGVVAPRTLSDDLVARNRAPVAIELGSRPGTRLGGLTAAWVNHPRLRPAGFWRREFGYDAWEERGADLLASLRRITAADLQRYYDAYYGPATMTLIVVGGRPLAELMPTLEATFGNIMWRPAPPPPPPVQQRQRTTEHVEWRAGTTTRLDLRYRVAALDERDHVRLLFIEDLLRERLVQRLRWGATKSVYGVSAQIHVRGEAAYFRITADMSPDQEQHVRDVVDSELARLRDAAGDTAAFYADRDAVNRTLRVAHAAPASLRAFAVQRFYRPDLHPALPDMGAYYATVGPDSIAALADRLFTADNLVRRTQRPLPLHPAGLALLALLAGAAAVGTYRRLTFRSADMGRVRFVARLRPPLAVRLGAGIGAAIVAIVGLRLLAAAIHFAVAGWLLATGSFAALLMAGLSLVFLLTLGGLALLGAVHRKVLVFQHEVRIKSPTYRSVIIPAADIVAARLVYRRTGLRLRRPAVAARRGAVFLELRDGTGFLLHVRHGHRLVSAIDQLSAVGDRTASAHASMTIASGLAAGGAAWGPD